MTNVMSRYSEKILKTDLDYLALLLSLGIVSEAWLFLLAGGHELWTFGWLQKPLDGMSTQQVGAEIIQYDTSLVLIRVIKNLIWSCICNKDEVSLWHILCRNKKPCDLLQLNHQKKVFLFSFPTNKCKTI